MSHHLPSLVLDVRQMRLEPELWLVLIRKRFSEEHDDVLSNTLLVFYWCEV